MIPKEKAMEYWRNSKNSNERKAPLIIDIALKEVKGNIEKKIFASDLKYDIKIKIKKIYDIEFGF